MLAELAAIKLLIAVLVVLGLTIIAERAGPKAAGILAGVPTGSAITLFFIGIENGAAFASSAAIYNLVGIIAMQATLLAYYWASLRFQKRQLLLCSLCAFGAYFASIFILHLFSFDLLWAVLLPLLSIGVFTYFFRGIEESGIKERVKLGFGVLAFRAFAAAAIILAIIEASSFVGPQWAGLFTAFPTTTVPLILILHRTYGIKPVHTVIKNFTFGLASLVAYSLTVSIAYPAIGVFYGTLAAFAGATLVCALVFLLQKARGKK